MYWAVLLIVAVVVLLQVHAQDNAANDKWGSITAKDVHQDAQTGNRKPHIIFIVADDLGWHDVSWHNPKVHTPNLGKLATTGVILNQSYVMHICTPSRSALMTGRYPFTIGRQHGVLRPMEPLGLTLNHTILPQELKKLGYSTHAVGKWHLGFCNWKYTPTKRGFDTFYGYYNGAEDYFTHRRESLVEESNDGDYCVNSRTPYHETPTSATVSNTPQVQGRNDVNTQTETGSESVQDECASRLGGYDFRNNTIPDFDVAETYSTYVYASYIEELLARRNASEPMFLYMPFQSVHAPLQVPGKYIEPFKYVGDHNRRTFMGMLSALDEAVGRIVEALKETGHYNNSIIVFTTDNGGQTKVGGNNWPLRGRKATLWEGGTRGSAFVHSPLLNKTGTVSNQLVHVSDWFATLVGVAGGNVTEGLDSIDQWAAISGNADPPRDVMIYNLDDSEGILGGIRIGNYKLLLGEQGFDEWVKPPEGLPKEKLIENYNKTEDITEMEHDIRIKENVISKKRRKDINNRKLKRKLRKKEKLKQKIKREKLVFQKRVSIKTDDNNILNENSPLIILKRVKRNKRQSSSPGQHLTVDHGEQRPFIVQAKPDVQVNYTKKINIYDSPRDRPSPVTFADLLNWNVEDLVDYKKLKLRVFNLKTDPTEHHDLANKNPSLVKQLLGQLLLELPRLVPPEVKPEDHRGNPRFWDNIWSPGWC